MTTAGWALVISLVSLGFSIWTGFANRRATQFKSLADLRTKAEVLRWQMRYRIEDVKDLDRKLRFVDGIDDDNLGDVVERLEKSLASLIEDAKVMDKAYTQLSIIPFTLPASQLEDLHHGIDSMAASVEASRNELLKRFTGRVDRIIAQQESKGMTKKIEEPVGAPLE